jgi:NDP-sugar pyrophosphorylase family protein/lipopolysaccharide/colanic/teichoic acid biosynthesis glycosyltransferase
VTEFDFILSHLPQKIEHLLGNGARWGSRFRFHLARDASRPYNMLKTLSGADANNTNDKNNTNGSILLAHADRLPQLPDQLNIQMGQSAVLYCLHNTSVSSENVRRSASLSKARSEISRSQRQTGGLSDDAQEGYEWTGWAWLSNHFIAALPGDLDEAAFESHLMQAAFRENAVIEVPRVLSVRSYEKLLAAHAVLLAKEFPGLMLHGQEAEPGIWLSRNVSLHPTAELIAPVYIGENCRIGMGTQLGPNAVIGHNCVLDARCIVTDSVIFPGSYVGEALGLENVIVDKNLLVNARLGAAVPVADDFILGSLSDNQLRAGVNRWLSRFAAWVLLAISWPILLATVVYLKLARRGPVLVKRECVRLPAPANEAQWRTFQLRSFQTEPGQGNGRLSGLFLRFLPALINVAKGELSFVGVRPRSKGEAKLLSHDWQALYLHSKAGIVTEADVLYGAHPDEDELYSAEAFYSAAAGMGHDAKLMLSYAGQLLKAPSVTTESHQGLS